MANWNLPTATSGYLDFVTEMNDKFVDAGTLSESPTNQPEKYIRYNRSINVFQEWVAGNWQNKVLSIAGGGTGSSTQAGIIANLGLGSMSTQNNNAVNITGGSITGVALDAGSITAGIVPLGRGGTGSSLAITPYGTVMLSDGIRVLLISGREIAELNASSLINGTVPDARLSSNVVLKNAQNIFTGENAFQGYVHFQPTSITTAPTVEASQPSINFYEVDQPADKHYIRIATENNAFYVQALNDAFNIPFTFFYATNSGIVIGPNGENPIYANGSALTNLNGSNITTGLINPNRLGASPDSSKFLRGDGVWAVPSGGGGASPIPAGMIGMFDTACPAGWTRFSQMDNRFPLGSGGAGGVGGASSHGHNFSGNTDGGGSHSHGFSGSGGLSGARTQGNVLGFTAGFSGGGVQTADAGESFQVLSPAAHTHGVNITIDLPVNGGSVSISGSTDGVGNHAHSYSGSTDARDNIPPYYTLVFCRKD